MIRIILILALIFISGCHPGKNNNLHTIKVGQAELNKELFFSGIVKPLSIVDVNSQLGGTVVKKYFTYGQQLHKGDLLLELTSPKYVSDYQQALIQYLRAKDEYNSKKTKFVGTQELWNNKLISRDEFRGEESGLAGAYLSYMQAHNELKTLLGHDIDDQLNIKDIDAVKKMLDQLKTTLKITAPCDGIALFSTKKSEMLGGEEDLIETGTEVKPGQTVVSIGDMSGISIDVEVGEIEIDELRTGQEVSVAGVSFPEILKGQVSVVGVQAKNSSAESGHPIFSVKIVVPQLTPLQKKFIRVGMSTKVSVKINSPSRILVPLTAVYEQYGRTFVKILDKKSKIKPVEIHTGETTINEVEVTKGLQNGDEIVLAN